MGAVEQTIIFILLTAGSILLALTGLLITRRAMPVERLKVNHEVGGIFFAVLGTAYAVLLSFIVVAAWTQFGQDQTISEQEAAQLGSIFWLAEALPRATRLPIQESLRDYAQVVATQEWPLMSRGGESARAWQLSDQLWRTILQSQVDGQQNSSVYSQLLQSRSALDSDRRLRLLSSHAGIPAIMWVVLLAGGVGTIGFTYFFATDHFWPQALMVSGLTAMIVLVLLVVYDFNSPYDGAVAVRPTGFQSVVQLANAEIGK